MKRTLPKILAVLGPTSSGKSDLAVFLAEKFDGEVVSADSRQVYRGLDIATGKITAEEMRGIPHHLLDVADPKDRHTVSHFKRDAEFVIDDILSRGKLPIICGGTMQFVNAVTENFITPETLPDEKLRGELYAKSNDELFAELQTLDPRRAEKIDRNNPRRLVRAIEIARALGSVPKIPDLPKKYDTLKIAIQTDKEILRERIGRRLDARLKLGMIAEAEKLHASGISFERMRELGLEYRYLADLFEGRISGEKMKEKIFFKDWQYAKRQITWLKRDPEIRWFPLSDQTKIVALSENFLTS
ncbi:MAG: tRNA (adenosine(37)-N6)-dimethylallyltransferase MiaA [Candidatus Paceibacterota bacterium]|jgi:tRNA dimethylallyltransferase|nr:tRNA (adenosine(37)-N6)-dimethylallyltransferase MiaA [Candidatus Paceibacterota bacterium]